MFELSEENDLMESSDGSIKLTTHRLLQKTAQGTNQMMLEDYTGFKIVKANIGSYGILTIIFALLTAVAIAKNYDDYSSFWSFFKSVEAHSLKSALHQSFLRYLFMSPFFSISLFLLLTSIAFYSIARRRHLKVYGKFNTIEIRIKNIRTRSIDRFINALVAQSNIAKENAAKRAEQASTK
jgi:hypothetical protein